MHYPQIGPPRTNSECRKDLVRILSPQFSEIHGEYLRQASRHGGTGSAGRKLWPLAYAQSGGDLTRTMFDDRDIMTAWATHQLGHAALGDARMTQRLVRLVSTLSQEPAASMPDACGPWSDTKAVRTATFETDWRTAED